MEDKSYTELQIQLEEAKKETAFYKRLSQEAGNQRLRETEKLSNLIERLKHAEKGRERLISELQDALSQVKTLHGMLPICASCKKIKNDEGYWEQMEMYIESHSEAEFSHGLCPDCARRLYPDLYKTTE